MTRILVIRLRRLGDLLLCTPALRALRTAYPKARIEMLAGAPFTQAVRGNASLDVVRELRSGATGFVAAAGAVREARYDLVLDLQSSPRSSWIALLSGAPLRIGWQKGQTRDWIYHRVVPGYDEADYAPRRMLRFLRTAGVVADQRAHLDLRADWAEWGRMRALLRAARHDSSRPLIAISAVSRTELRRWPATHYAELADRLIRELGAEVILTAGPGEQAQTDAVVRWMRETPLLSGTLTASLGELSALYGACALWIGNDGGPKHVAVASGCPVVMVAHEAKLARVLDLDDPGAQTPVVADLPGGHVEDVRVAAVFDVAAARLERVSAPVAAPPRRAVSSRG